YLPDGHVEFHGRADRQVKLRGFRIELGEIEAVLNQHPAIRESVVLAREATTGEKRPLAYVVPTPHHPPPTPDPRPAGGGEKREERGEKRAERTATVAPHSSLLAPHSAVTLSPCHLVTLSDHAPLIGELRMFLAARLPDYMVPSAFVQLDALPLTP